jgi:hypothetical protein
MKNPMCFSVFSPIYSEISLAVAGKQMFACLFFMNRPSGSQQRWQTQCLCARCVFDRVFWGLHVFFDIFIFFCFFFNNGCGMISAVYSDIICYFENLKFGL